MNDIKLQSLTPNNRARGIFLKRFLVLASFGFLLFAGISCGDAKKEEAKDEGYYTCSMHPQVIQQEPGQCPICGMELIFQPASGEHEGHDHGQAEEQGHDEGSQTSPEEGMEDHSEHYETMVDGDMEAIYVCPMHPEVTSAQPGQCPICGMDLVKKERPKNMQNGKTSGGAFRFTVTQNVLVNSNFLTAPVVKEKFERRARYSGHIDYNEDPDRLVIISTKYQGWVEKLFVSKEGQTIKKGELLMGVYSPAILAAKEEYITTYSSIRDMYAAQGKPLEQLRQEPTLVAARRKLAYLDVSSSQIQKLETSGEAGRLTWYPSPIGGVIVKKSVLQGGHIQPGQELFRIANLSRLWGFIHIFEKDLAYIKKGQKVKVLSSAYPELQVSGRVDLIYPYIEQGSRDIKVRIVIPNTAGKLRPGMFVEIELVTEFPGESLVIPDSAVIYSGEKSYVFVSLGRGLFELRPVKVKTTSNARSVISSGVAENELVVVNGQFLLDSEASLKEAITKGRAATHQH